MKTTSLSFVENKESRVSSMNQEVIDTTSVAVRSYKVGNIYRFANHTFAVWAKGAWKNETTGKVSNHVVFAVTFDGGTQEYYLDSEGIKQKIGDERRATRAASMDGNGKATKVKRTTAESAAQIETKYADTIKNVREKVSKLQADDRILGALNLLCTMIDSVATERIENVTNVARNAYLSNVARREEATAELNQKQAEMQTALSSCNFAQVAILGNTAKELQAEIILLEQKIAEYETAQIVTEANNETASEETEETTAENASEQPAE